MAFIDAGYAFDTDFSIDLSRAACYISVMKMIVFLLLASLAHAEEPLKVEDCSARGIDLTNVISPPQENSRSFYNNKVSVFGVDVVEPVCCARGVAVILPDVQAETGGSKCFTVLGTYGIKVKSARSKYSEKQGLLIEVDATRYGPHDGQHVKAPPVKLRVNLKDSSVKLE